MSGNFLKSYATYFLPVSPRALVYMLQQVDYDVVLFGEWLDRFPDLSRVMYRQKLILTAKARLLLGITYAVWGLGYMLVLYLIFTQEFISLLFILLLFPVLLIVPLILAASVGRMYLQLTLNKTVRLAAEKLKGIKAERIAVLGSYGKTTMKEMLTVLLAEEKKVAVTPGNKNILSSHAHWILSKLHGDEDFIIFELGEYRPGDIASMATMIQPTMAIITGVAPNHLDSYKNLEALYDDFVSITSFVTADTLFVSKDADEKLQLHHRANCYSDKTVLGWTVTDCKVTYGGTDFTMTKQGVTHTVHTALLGLHLVAPVAACIAIADKYGVSWQAIENGLQKIVPYEHRMKPIHMNGAWIIDDTYNGNIEGIRAGLELLKTLPAKRKTYVTPGLVEQGVETQRIHLEIGKLIAGASPDKVILFDNSVRQYIEEGLSEGKFKGELIIQTDPLQYYTTLEHSVAAGDLVLLQNDWTDNYN